MKSEKYIQLGEKKNGRFVKSETYSLDEFRKFLYKIKPDALFPSFSILDKFLGKKERWLKRTSHDDTFLNLYIDLCVMNGINNIINKDKKGKKVKYE